MITVQIQQVSKNSSRVTKIQVISRISQIEREVFQEKIHLKSIKSQDTREKYAFKKSHGNLEKKVKDQSSDYSPEKSGLSFEVEIQVSYVKQTKNIPKLYGNAFIKFIENQPKEVNEVLDKFNVNKIHFYEIVKEWSKTILTIDGIRSMWQQNNNPYANIFRIICNLYLRKYVLHHIFNSKISNCKRALKYRYKFIEGVRDPSSFTLMKQF